MSIDYDVPIDVVDDEMSIYEEKGYSDREAYLEALSIDYGVPIDVVDMMADLMGPEEDFDGLVSMLCDYEDFG